MNIFLEFFPPIIVVVVVACDGDGELSELSSPAAHSFE